MELRRLTGTGLPAQHAQPRTTYTRPCTPAHACTNTTRARCAAAAVSAPVHEQEHQLPVQAVLHALEQQHTQPVGGQHEVAERSKQASRIPLRLLRDIIRGRKGSAQLQSVTGDPETARKEPSKILTGQIVAARTWQEALTLFLEFSDVFNAVNTAALVTHISKLIRSSSSSSRGKGIALNTPGGVDLMEALQELRDFSEGELPNYGPQGLANTTCAFANLGCLSRRYAQLVTARSEPSEFSNKELTQLLWSFATAGYCPDARWLRACYSELAVRRSSLNNRELCSSLWALAKLNLDPGPGWMSIVLYELSARSDTLIEPDLANILWALSTLNHQPPRQIMSNFLSASARLATSMQPKSLCIILWSASVGGWPIPPPWVNAMCEGLRRHCLRTAGPPRISCSDAAMALHALGRLRFQPPVEITSSLSSVVLANMGADTRTDDLVSWSCGLAGLGYRPSAQSLARFHHACIKRRRLLKCMPEQLTAMLCAQAKLGHGIHPAWIACLRWQLLRRLPDFKSRELSNTLWALARTRHCLPPGTLSSILHALVQYTATSPAADAPLPHTPSTPRTSGAGAGANAVTSAAVAASQPHIPATAQAASPAQAPQSSHAPPHPAWHTAWDGRRWAAAWGSTVSGAGSETRAAGSVPYTAGSDPHAAGGEPQQQRPQLQQQRQQQQQHGVPTACLAHTQHAQHAQQQQPPPVSSHPMFSALKQLQVLQQERFLQQRQSEQIEQGHHHHDQQQHACDNAAEQQQLSERDEQEAHDEQQQQPQVEGLQQQHGAQGTSIPHASEPHSAARSVQAAPQPQLPTYAWRNPRPLQTTVLPFSHAHPAASAEAATLPFSHAHPAAWADAAAAAVPHTHALPQQNLQQQQQHACVTETEQQQQRQQQAVTHTALAAFAPPNAASDSAACHDHTHHSVLGSPSSYSVKGSGGDSGSMGARVVQKGAMPAVGINSGDFGRSNTRGGPVSTSSSGTASHGRRSYAPRHVANALWSLPMVLPAGQRLEFGAAHRQLLRAAERAWIGPYFRAACIKQGTRGMLLGAQLVGRIKTPPNPETTAPSSPDTPTADSSLTPYSSSDSSRTSTSRNSTRSSSSSSSSSSSRKSSMSSSSGTAQVQHSADVMQACKHAHLVSRNAEYAMRRNAAAEELSRSMAVPPCELVQTAQAFAALGHRPSPAWLHLHQWAAARQWPTIDLRQRKRLVRCYRELCFHVEGSNIGLSVSAVGEDGGGVAGAACELPSVRLQPSWRGWGKRKMEVGRGVLLPGQRKWQARGQQRGLRGGSQMRKNRVKKENKGGQGQ